MKHILRIAVISFCTLNITFAAKGQKLTDTSSTSKEGFPFVRFQFASFIPGGDYEKSFGNTYSVGGAIGYKSGSNWQFDIESGYFFGADVKREDMLNGIINSAGDATDLDGELVRIVFDIRAINIFSSVGKIFPLSTKNNNSGILLKAGVGYLQHRIKIDFRDGEVFQLNDEMLKGYDRLHTGIALKQFIGYQYYGESNLFNFYVGFEMIEGFTINRRAYNYDTQSFDQNRKTDLLYGLRFGWSIPIRQRASEEFYYY